MQSVKTVVCLQFFKKNVRDPVWTCRDPKNFRLSVDIFPFIIFSDSMDPIFNSRDPNP